MRCRYYLMSIFVFGAALPVGMPYASADATNSILGRPAGSVGDFDISKGRRAKFLQKPGLAINSFGGKVNSGFKWFINKDDGFKILAPDGAKIATTIEAKTIGVLLTATIQVGKTRFSDGSTQVVVSVRPDRHSSQSGMDDGRLNQACMFLQRSVGGKEISRDTIKINNINAREVTYQLADNTLSRSRVCFGNSRLFEVTVTGPDAAVNSAATKSILSSFSPL